MTLDFTSDKTKRRKMVDMLNSPDINMLKLASPELERLIIQQGGVSTTPTATPNTQILFPKSVTEEQEAYARGFVDALAELHQKTGDEDDDDDDDDDADDDEEDMVTTQTTGPTYTTLTNASSASNVFAKLQASHVSSNKNPLNGGVYTYTTVTQLPDSALTNNTSTIMPLNSMNTNIRTQDIIIRNQPVGSRTASPAMSFTTSPHHSQLMQVKEEPQRVPSLSPQLAPIDMGHQEHIKLQRKRARNRVAARKCRTRKLERISRLEDRVDDLKGQNTKLVNTANDLREQVFALKQQILEHVNSGCKVMLSTNML
jgi:hypothetical protein